MSVRRWTNWAGNLRCRCEVVAPRSAEELQSAVKSAAEGGHRVRATGGSYSWSPLVPNDGTIIRMHHLDGLLALDVESATVEIECGMTIKKLTKLTAHHGLTLRTPTLFPMPTIGGVIAAGCHGTDRRAGNFSDAILEMSIVKADGSRQTIGKNDRDFPAAQVALGSLGIIYSVKLQLEREFQVYTEKRCLPLDEVLDGFEDLRNSVDFLEIFWWPFQDTIWLYMMTRTDSEPDPKTWRSRLSTAFTTWYETEIGGTLLPWLARYTPQLTPFILKISCYIAEKQGVTVQRASDAFHFQKAYPKCWDLSYAVPVKDAARAWRDGINLVNQYADAGLYPVNLLLHGRFTGSSAAWLAPDYRRDTAYVEVTTIRGTPHWLPFFEEVEKRWFAIEGARPHWCKNYGQRREIAARYPRMNEFLDVRQRWDPDRVFLNDFLENEIFQLPRRDGASKRQPTPSETYEALRV